MAKRIVIGYATLDEPQQYHPDTAYAGQAITIDVPPGCYPIEVRQYQGCTYLAIPMPGAQTYSHWQNANGLRVDKSRKSACYTAQPYGYALAEAVLTGTSCVRGAKIELSAGVEARYKTFTSVVDGETRTTTCLYQDDVPLRVR